MSVHWTKLAQDDAESIFHYIAVDSLRKAMAHEERIMAAVARLARHQRLGRAGTRPGTRELVVPRTSYLVIYREENGGVEILRIFHGARDWP